MQVYTWNYLNALMKLTLSQSPTKVILKFCIVNENTEINIKFRITE